MLEYGADVWDGSLTSEQCQDIKMIQRWALRINYPKGTYEKASTQCGIKTLENLRDSIGINLIKNMIDPAHM